MLRFRGLLYSVFIFCSFELSSLQKIEACSADQNKYHSSSIMANSLERFVLGRLSIDSSKVMKEFPPRFTGNKKAIFNMICPADRPHKSIMEFARYTAVPIPESIQNMQLAPNVAMETLFNTDPFSYGPTEKAKGKSTLEWHVNFADPLLFGYYSSVSFCILCQINNHIITLILNFFFFYRDCLPRMKFK